MYPAQTDYLKVDSFVQASAALLAGGDDAKALAGGQTLIPMMKLRLVKPRLLVDLGGIAEARDVVVSDTAVEIGALARHAAIGRSAMAARFPIIRDCALGIADAQVRNMGTIGGSVAEADPSSCWPALLVALEAQALCLGPAGPRVQSVRELLADAYTPALDQGELITRIAIPLEALAGFGTFVAFKRCAPAYPTASCALQIGYDGATIAAIRLGFGALGLTALAFDAAAEMATGRPVTADLVDAIADAAAAFVEPLEDAKGTEGYKRSLARGLVVRAFAIVENRRLGRPAPETHQYYG